MSLSQRYTVPQGEAPVRLDVFLRSRLPGISRSYIQRAIEGGQVLVGGKRRAKGHPLMAGDEVVLEEFIRPEDRTLSPNPDLEIEVLLEDPHLLVLEKPAGIPVHPNDFDDTSTVVNFLLARYPEVVGIGEGELRPGIVHRLDTGTTGLLLVARTEQAYHGLKQQFINREIKKHYYALVLGHVEQKQTLDWHIAHHPKNQRKMIIVTQPKDIEELHARTALTECEPWQYYDSTSLLWVALHTGRMHQIRVHLAHAGHPLVGDALYQTASEKRSDRTKFPRPALHASRLRLHHPVTGRRLLLESPLPADFQALLEKLEQSSGSADNRQRQ